MEKVKLIAVGAFHNLALLEDGNLWVWGNNEYGQLGTGDTQPRSQPVPVQGLSGLKLVHFIYIILNFLYFNIFLKFPLFKFNRKFRLMLLPVVGILQL